MVSTLIPRSADYEVRLTQDHENLRHTIRDFAEKELRPVAAEIDRNNQIPRDLLTRIAKLGVSAITYKEEYGGLGGDPKGLPCQQRHDRAFDAYHASHEGVDDDQQDKLLPVGTQSKLDRR